MTNTQRQLGRLDQERRRGSGPTAPATAPMAPQMATATGSRSRGKARMHEGQRGGDERGGADGLDDPEGDQHLDASAPAAQASEATVNRAEPSRNIRLWPTRSASLPAGTSRAAKAIV